MHDILISNGTIIDGSGAKMYTGDIAVNDGIITEVGDLAGEKSRSQIDATGYYVMPGFIDISNRTDVYWRLFSDRFLESLLRQGITSIIGGNSGTSLAPMLNEQMLLSTQKWASVRDVNVSWQSMQEFLAAVSNHHITVNFGTFIGHGMLRRGIIGDAARELTDNETRVLLRYIRQAMKEGALGVSLGLIYTHGRDASVHEIESVAGEVKRHDGLLAVHLRDEDANLIDALDEILSVVRETGVRCHITHLKAVGQKYWASMETALERIDEIRAAGFDVTFDVYPYTSTGSVLYTFVPTWLSEGGKKMMLTRLKNDNIYEQAAKEINNDELDLTSAIVSVAPRMDTARGRSLGEIARSQHISVGELVLDLLIGSEGQAVILLNALSEENIIRALRSPYSLVTSNAPGYTITSELRHETLHPRSFGAFPRLFHRYVAKKEILSWEGAVHKCTGKVARALGLNDRGFIQEGLRADIAIIEPGEFRDFATVGSMPKYSSGVQWLIVGGVPTIDHGSMTGIRAGQVIKK